MLNAERSNVYKSRSCESSGVRECQGEKINETARVDVTLRFLLCSHICILPGTTEITEVKSALLTFISSCAVPKNFGAF